MWATKTVIFRLGLNLNPNDLSQQTVIIEDKGLNTYRSFANWYYL